MSRARLGELATMVVTLSLVLGATAGALRLLDALPGRLRHEPPGVRSVASVAEAERLIGARLWLPAYFPDSLRWPPRIVTVHAGPPAAVSLAFVDAADDVVLLLVQSLARRLVAPPPAPAASQVLQVRSITVADAAATLSRFVGDDGRVWHELAWTRDGRTLVLRSRGAADELVRMADSLEPRGSREP